MKKNHQPKLGEPKLILASASPRRKELLAALGIKFEIRPSSIPEEINKGEAPRDFALRMAREKAFSQAIEKGTYVLGADTIVCIGGEILGKPSGPAQAMEHLQKLSGKTHEVMTGYAIVSPPDKMICEEVATSRVTMKNMNRKEIENYVATGEPLDKAGAYAAQGIGKGFIAKIVGSTSNVIGLPIEELTPWFKRLKLL